MVSCLKQKNMSYIKLCSLAYIWIIDTILQCSQQIKQNQRKYHNCYHLILSSMSNQQSNSPIYTNKKSYSNELSTFFTLPQVNSKAYKETAAEIHGLMANLDSYTQNLEQKVGNLLSIQQNQFVNGYKQHMKKVKDEFNAMEQELKKLKDKIQYYENEGRLSTLLKKVMKLEQQNKKLLGQIVTKNKEIKSLQLGMQIDRKQIKRLEGKVKEFIRFKVMLKQDKQRESLNGSHVIKNQTLAEFKNPSPQQNTMFATQINLQAKPQQRHPSVMQKHKKYLKQNYSIPHSIENSQREHSNQRLSKFLTEQQTLNLRSLNQKSEQATDAYNFASNSEINRLQKLIKNLKKQNSKLLLYSSKFLESANSMQNFFFETVNDIRRNISVRKKIRECSLEDFRKQDKLELLIRVLSNDDMIVHLHQKIFGKKQKQVDKLADQTGYDLQSYFQKKVQGQNEIVENPAKGNAGLSRKKGFSYSHRNDQSNFPLPSINHQKPNSRKNI